MRRHTQRHARRHAHGQATKRGRQREREREELERCRCSIGLPPVPMVVANPMVICSSDVALLLASPLNLFDSHVSR